METNKERMLRVLSKFEKQIIVKDPDGEEIEICMCYPTVRNSEDFWDIIHTLMAVKNKGDVDVDPELQIGLIQDILPKINKFIIKGYEAKLNRDITSEEEMYYSALVFTNITPIINTFMDMATRMLGTGDEPKNPKAEVLPTE
ncbi:MAG: hypothetical protein PHC31_11000 [Clostridia bacterium]|nr:hypothetical protein [Clostridia bacterium]